MQIKFRNCYLPCGHLLFWSKFVWRKRLSEICLIYCEKMTQWQFWQWLSGARAQNKNKQYYYCFLFFLFLFKYTIQEKFTAWRVNSTLNFLWKTDITIIASRFVSKYIYVAIGGKNREIVLSSLKACFVIAHSWDFIVRNIRTIISIYIYIYIYIYLDIYSK